LKTELNPPVSKNTGNLLTRWDPVSFPRLTEIRRIGSVFYDYRRKGDSVNGERRRLI